jgi:hypothetical protein
MKWPQDRDDWIVFTLGVCAILVVLTFCILGVVLACQGKLHP